MQLNKVKLGNYIELYEERNYENEYDESSVRGIATETIKRIGAYAPPFSFREVKRIKTDKKGKKTA